MSTTLCKDNSVLLSVDYHGLDEVVDHQDVMMTRNELRAVMVWLAKLTISGLPSENCVSGINKIYHLFRTSNNEVSEAKRQLPNTQMGAEMIDP